MFKNKIANRTIVLFAMLVVAVFLFAPHNVFAQVETTGSAIEEGVTLVGEQTGLTAEDPRIVIARIIRYFLGVVGVIALGIVMYAGFLYMTSGGAPDKVEKAKKWLINGFIGLIIILLSFAITSYIINQLSEATGLTGDGGDPAGIIPPGSGGDISGFNVTVSPRGVGKAINSLVKVKYPMGEDPVSDNSYQNAMDNVKVYALISDANGDLKEEEVSGSITVSGKTITFTPSAGCPDNCSADHCFAENTDFRIDIGKLKSEDGDSILCSGQLATICKQTYFTTSADCDSQGPQTRINTPFFPVRQGDNINFETKTTDDYGVASLYFCPNVDLDQSTCQDVAPDTENSPTEFTYSFIADSIGYELGWRQALLTAYDLSDNSSQATRKYLVASEFCFDENDEFDCELPDCEIDCTTFCGASGTYFCQEKEDGTTECKCVVWPIITSIHPEFGPVDSFVTINGRNFGPYSDTSSVQINNVEAEPACGSDKSWSSGQVVVKVPTTTTGPIKLTNNVGDYTDTSDQNSLGWKGVFNVVADQSDWIGLCSVVGQEENVPEIAWVSSGGIGQLATAYGQNFGSKATAKVYFNAVSSSSTGLWQNDLINDIKIPNVAPGTVPVQASQLIGDKEIYSNAVNFSVKDLDGKIKISNIDPNPAPPEQYITITGENFGTAGSVTFVKEKTNEEFVGIQACDGGWQKNQIIIQVPDSISDGDYFLTVKTGNQSARAPFTVDSSLDLNPGICEITPDNGPVGTGVSLYGTGFGTAKTAVTFFDNQVVGAGGLGATTWTPEAISNVFVPAAALTGQVYVTNSDGRQSNKVRFDVGQCTATSCDTEAGEVCCQQQSCLLESDCVIPSTKAEYAWFFSTGRIPKVPKIIERNCVLSEYNQSPSPTKNTQNACPNGLIGFTFNMLMAPDSFFEKVEVRRCKDQGAECDLNTCSTHNCESFIYPFKVFDYADDEETGTDDSDYFDFYQSNYNNEKVTEVVLSNYKFDPDRWYQVIVRRGVLSIPEVANEAPLEMPSDYTWRFKTGNNDCSLAAVVVNPAQGLIEEIYQEQKYRVNGQGEECAIIDVCGDDWQWSVLEQADKVKKNPKVLAPQCVAYFGVIFNNLVPETPPGNPAVVQASAVIDNQSFADIADLTVAFRDPSIIDYWPNCNEACINGNIGALFNTYMDYNTVANPSNVRLFKCENKECLSNLTEIPVSGPGNFLNCIDTTGQNYLTVNGKDIAACTQMSLDVNLDPSSYYRVAIMNRLTSLSKKNLSGLNYSTTAIQTNCGNGIIEPGEDCEAACRDAQGDLCVPTDDNVYPTECTDCSLSYNPYCTSECKWAGFRLCQAGETEDCCGNGYSGLCNNDADCALGEHCSVYGNCVEIYANNIGKEECEADCTRVEDQVFVGTGNTSALADCQNFITANPDTIAGIACECEVPDTCDDAFKYCANRCEQNPNQTCFEDSLTCTCLPPKVCSQSPTEFCSADRLACTCVPEKACEENVNQICTESSADCTCLEVGRFEFEPDTRCFNDSDDSQIGKCIKQNICLEDANSAPDAIRSCTASDPGCSCVALTEDNCPADSLVCPQTCSVPVKNKCVYGEAGCGCNFPPGCINCVADQLSEAEQQSLFDSFSWVFRTQKSAEECKVHRIEVDPKKYLSNRAEEVLHYSATPFGEPDQCSVSGQRLNAFTYDWQWSEPKNKAVITSTGDKPADEKLIWIRTTTYSKEQVGGCTEKCLNTGSRPYGSSCGNGVIEIGEECDDGNSDDNDGCSSKCLHEGTQACFGPNDSNCCGNGKIESFEECDDGDNDSGDGCSANCLNEGSASSGFECGNGIKQFGEDADYGSLQVNQAYGLNSRCLFEGSKYLHDQGLSICGNGEIEFGEECELTICTKPDGESCDFGEDYCLCSASNDPICSSNCLYKGLASCTPDNPTDCCGNGVVCSNDSDCQVDQSCSIQGVCLDNGEECEAICLRQTADGSAPCTYENSLTDDTCSCSMPDYCNDNCLNRGSSFTYNSFCGNNEIEAGEDPACELGAKTFGNQFGSPYSIITVLGNISGDKTQDTAHPTATIPDDQISGHGELTYGYSGLDDKYPEGCDPGNPPKIIDQSVTENELVCLNSQFVFTFNTSINSIDGTFDADNVNFQYQVIDGSCPSNEFAQGPISLVKKIVTKVKHFVLRFIGREVVAAVEWCDVPNVSVIKNEISATKDQEARSQVFIYASDGNANAVALSKDTQYRINFTDLVNKCDLPFADTPFITFTGDRYCKLDSIAVVPAYTLATEVGSYFDLYHYAKSGNSYLVPLVGLYDWVWKPWETTDSFIVTIENFDPAIATVGDKNGIAEVIATAEITTDEIFTQPTDGINLQVQGFGTVETLICENPWIWPYASFEKEEYGSRLFYCRDQGAINDFSDDLPLLTPIIPSRVPDCSDGLDNDGDGLIDYGVGNEIEIIENFPVDNLQKVFTGSDHQIHFDFRKFISVDGQDKTNWIAFFIKDNDTLKVFDHFEIEQGGAYQLNIATSGIDHPIRLEVPILTADQIKFIFTYLEFETELKFDPDCTSPDDQDESTGGAPQCSDGIDNDGDGLIDYNYKSFKTIDSGTYQIDRYNSSTSNFDQETGIITWDNTPVGTLYGRFSQSSSADHLFEYGLSIDDLTSAVIPSQGQAYEFYFTINSFDFRAYFYSYGAGLYEVNGMIFIDLSLVEDISDPDCDSPGDYESAIQAEAIFESKALADYFFLRVDDPFFPSTNDFSPDAISLRVFPNPQNLSAHDWYFANVPNPNNRINDIQVACDYDPIYNVETCYHGVQDGNTAYISGGNVAGNVLYNNIYVIGYNQGGNSNTINIMNQMIKSFRLNQNIIETGADRYQLIKRDIKRLNDINHLTALLQKHFKDSLAYPTLSSGTYVNGESFSTWPSWQSVFANALGEALPSDPLNFFRQYDASEQFDCADDSCRCLGQCSDGIDNDGDGKIDIEDEECISNKDLTEGPGDTQIFKQCNTSDQCFFNNLNWMCSVCEKGSSIQTCYNSNNQSVGFVGDEFFNSFLYRYNFQAVDQCQIDYKLEGQPAYYQVNNPPAKIITP